MNDYERRDRDLDLERREAVSGVETGPGEVEIYDRPDTAIDDSTGMGLWAGLLVLIVVAVLVVLLLLFLF